MNRILTILASAILIVAGGFFLLTGTHDLLSGAFPGWIEGFAGVCLVGAGFALLRSEFPIPLRRPQPIRKRMPVQPIPSPLSPSAVQFMNRFKLWYVVANAILAVPIMLALAWAWS